MNVIAYYLNGSSYETQKLLLELPENTLATDLWKIAKSYEDRFYQGYLVRIEVVQTEIAGGEQ